MSIAQKAARLELGDFMSTICFKAVVVGLEEALGEKAAAIALIAAGRKRGKQLVEEIALGKRNERARRVQHDCHSKEGRGRQV